MINTVRRVLCVGAHPDDIEIGCLGSLLNLNASVDFMIACGSNERKMEQEASCKRLQNIGIQINELFFFGLEDGRLPIFRDELKKMIRQSNLGGYDLIFTHYSLDRHQDHRVVGEVTLESFRESQILAYEIPKFDGCTFSPTLYIPFDDEIMDKKLDHLMHSFESQRKKYWYKENVFRGLGAIRGVECRSTWAEAFVPVKLIYSGKGK